MAGARYVTSLAEMSLQNLGRDVAELYLVKKWCSLVTSRPGVHWLLEREIGVFNKIFVVMARCRYLTNLAEMLPENHFIKTTCSLAEP
jgi:hypothetical protein